VVLSKLNRKRGRYNIFFHLMGMPVSQSDAYGHTMGKTPEPVRFQKLSLIRPS
jgi:hypothetical protein